jgi:hypothetical protein
LIIIVIIYVIGSGSYRKPGDNFSGKFSGITTPLLYCITLYKRLVKFPANKTYRLFLQIFGGRHRRYFGF